MFYTPVCYGVHVRQPKQLVLRVHFEFGKGWSPILLGMSVAFDWVGFQG